MKTIRYNDRNFERALRELDRDPSPDPAVRSTVEAIIEDVRSSGDKALVEYTRKFDGARLSPEQMAVTSCESMQAVAEMKASELSALRSAHANILAFAKKSLRKNWSMQNRQGAVVGERFDPFRRVGIYVPGGTAPLVSTALMTTTLAKAAGVPEIVVTTPCGRDGSVSPHLLAALEIGGATEVHRVGGAQAVAALAYGTRTIRPVAKVFGPGNAYVVEAKRQVFGKVAVDLLPGPSEILVLADSSANPEWVAADLLAQAEHGARSVVGLITNSARLINRTQSAMQRRLKTLSRADHLAPVIDQSLYFVLVRSISHGVHLVNRFAPEHLSIATRSPREVSSKISTSGAIFVGGISPVAVGDFLAGPSHELPTGGAGKSFAGLTADQFQRRTSIVELNQAAVAKSAPIVNRFGRMEGLDAHAQSVAARLE